MWSWRVKAATACSSSTGISCMKAPSTPSSRCENGAGAIARPDLSFAIADHYVPTRARAQPIANPEIARMVDLLAQNAARAWHRPYRARRSAPGHRACRHPRARPDLARIDHRVRRQPHIDAWRLRRLCVRHRRVRGRACADDPGDLAEKAEAHARARSRARRCRASRRRTSRSPSSRASARMARKAMRSNMRARPCARSRWKGA